MTTNKRICLLMEWIYKREKKTGDLNILEELELIIKPMYLKKRNTLAYD